MLKESFDNDFGFWFLVKKRRFKEGFAVLGATPWLWVVTALCPVAAGALASFYPAEIKESTSLFFFSEKIFSPVATFFWLAIILTGLSLGLAQWSQAMAAGALRSMIRRLQTLPPSGFLESYRDTYRESARQAFLTMIYPEASKDQIDQSIRNILGAIAEIARDFDEQESAIYGANLMVWRENGSAFEEDCPLHVVPFVPNDSSVLGYLELVQSLSTATNLGNKIDAKISPVVFPVPVDTEKYYDSKNHARDPVIPGAAKSFVANSFELFESIESYVKWLDDHSAKGLDYINPLKKYFVEGLGNHVKSFGSRPIVSTLPGSEQSVIAIINIHSNQENILQDSGQTLFAPLIEPFCFFLALLLEKRSVILSSTEPKDGVTKPSEAESGPLKEA
ncbi:hypothetical protein [Comamonas sp. C24C]